MADGKPNPGDPHRGASRSGDDVRRRGWFWHWNTIITQYAPLIGLKGVGLLNSYTVWTDRREESPHRGYAFPSQQREADFYGEDRAELITINKILVALDLVEIRKEMVLRVDDRGRRWRVPHNLYRVKDHHGGFILAADDVMRVVELATRDTAVYRYIRRIFSPRFAPIDSDNVWHQILPVVRQTEAWQRLAARAAKEDARASARTKAGHAKRGRASGNAAAVTQRQVSGDTESNAEAPAVDSSPPPKTIVDPTNSGRDSSDPVDVAPTNSGAAPDVDLSNSGLTAEQGTSDALTNEGKGNSVAKSNRTYDQSSSTTTTTTHRADQEVRGHDGRPASSAGAGPVLDPTPAVLACFEAANDREATPLERELLAELEATFDTPAQGVGATGGEWVAAAIREAVNSGSRFVAPKRIREILTRWATERSDSVRPGSVAAPSSSLVPDDQRRDVRMPNGAGGRQTWEFTCRLLSTVLDDEEMRRLFDGSTITGYRAGTVSVSVSTAEAAERLSGEYYDLVARKLREALRRPARIRFHAAEQAAENPEAQETEPGTVAPPATPPAKPQPLPQVMLPGGLSNLQVWAAAQEELARRVSDASFETWIRPATLLGMDDDGDLIVGTSSAFAQQRLESRLLPEIEAVLRAILGQPVTVRAVVASEWLRTRGQSAGNEGGRGSTQ